MVQDGDPPARGCAARPPASPPARPRQGEDLAAECLARAYAAKEPARITNGRSYLFGIARNLVVDAARREKVVALDLVADLDRLLVDNSVEAGLQARDELRWLGRVVETLPPQCRQVFLMRRVLDRSVAEIAGTLGLSVSTIEKHLTKAVTRVMDAVRDREDDEGERIAAHAPAAKGLAGGRRAPRR